VYGLVSALREGCEASFRSQRGVFAAALEHPDSVGCMDVIALAFGLLLFALCAAYLAGLGRL
jgi:hypothetical protein